MSEEQNSSPPPVVLSVQIPGEDKSQDTPNNREKEQCVVLALDASESAEHAVNCECFASILAQKLFACS